MNESKLNLPWENQQNANLNWILNCVALIFFFSFIFVQLYVDITFSRTMPSHSSIFHFTKCKIGNCMLNVCVSPVGLIIHIRKSISTNIMSFHLIGQVKSIKIRHQILNMFKLNFVTSCYLLRFYITVNIIWLNFFFFLIIHKHICVKWIEINFNTYLIVFAR